MLLNSRRFWVVTLLVWAATFHAGFGVAQTDGRVAVPEAAEPREVAESPEAAETAAPADAENGVPAEAGTVETASNTGVSSEQSSGTAPGEQLEKDKQPPAGDLHAQKDVPYTSQGADTCLKCHDEDAEVPVLALFKTKHALRADERTPMAGLQCESCHGPGGEHGKRVRRGEERPPIRNFGRHANTPADEQNRVCLDCHDNHERADWPGSVHERHDVACATCHRVHAVRDPVLTTGLEPDICLDCHKQQRAEIHKASTHPLRYGQMACSDCHEPHGSTTEALLKRETLNQTCYDCHAEKRGPFLWEHAPAAEDCSLCHRPHGSNHPDLLTRRAPLLCQQCHSLMGHPSVQYTGRGLPGHTPSPRVLAGSCTNCHTQVHGSNHPSGADLSR